MGTRPIDEPSYPQPARRPAEPHFGDWLGQRSRSIGADRKVERMAVDVGYVSAVGAGAISFLSPCVLPLVPPYLCYMAGVTVDDFRAGGEQAAKSGARLALVTASIAFVLGFTTVFVALGAGASTIG